jgi:periplasmic divalent cation tolerance protein
MNESFSVLYVTFPDHDTAIKICEDLVRQKLIACANLFKPHLGVYEWEGEIQTTSEIGAFLKTRTGLYNEVEQRILSQHPYECPCIISLPITRGYFSFLNWIDQQVKPHIQQNEINVS